MEPDRKKKSILGIGELLWDILPGGRRMGGAVANFIYFCRLSGLRSTLVSRVGEDDSGKELVSAVEELGLETEYIQTDPEHSTGTVDVELDEKGIPEFTIHEHTAWDYIEFVPELEERAAQTDGVCFGTVCQRSSVARHTVRSIVERVPEKALRVYDINLRQHFYNEEIIRWSCVNADVVKLNEDEVNTAGTMFALSGDMCGITEGLIEMFGISMVVLTRGEEGSLIFTGEGVYEHPGYPAEVRDSVGAGDSFTAAVTAGLLNGTDIDDFHDRANRIAAFVCSQEGATPPVPREILEP